MIDTLDEFQQPTLEYNGNAILIAGPGAGKTRTIAAKMDYLRQKNVGLGNMKMLTFSNEAKGELLKRLPYLKDSKSVSTIHSFGYSLLGGQELNLIDSYADEDLFDTRKGIIYEAMGGDILPADCMMAPVENKKIWRYLVQNNSTMPKLVSTVLSAIDKYKSTPDIVLDPGFKLFYDHYEEEKKRLGLIDYNDMLLMALEAIKKTPVHIPWVFIDEGHDTNMLQYELISRIQFDHIWAVFSPHQMIYRWNGADERNIERFRKDFQPKEFKLLNNWRSPKEIVDLLESIYPDGLVPKGNGPGKVEIVRVHEDPWSTVHGILRGTQNYEILARTNKQLYDEEDRFIFDPKKKKELKSKKLTIHSSKGTESETVIVLGAGDNYCPFFRSDDEEEEKNLFYVACSRAKKNLYLLYTDYPSQFLENYKEVDNVNTRFARQF